MKILTIDLGEHTGWATNGDICGMTNVKPKRHEGAGIYVLNFKKLLKNLSKQYGPFDLVAFEEVAFGSQTYAMQRYGEYAGTLMGWCEEEKIPYRAIAVSTIKVHATGRKGASKNAMILAAECLGYDPIDDNAADAACLFDYIQKEYE